MGHETTAGSTLTDAMRAVAGANVLTPKTAKYLLIQAADAIDAQASRIGLLEKNAIGAAGVVFDLKTRLEQACRENRDLAERLSKAQEAMDSIAEGSRGACSGSDC